MVIAEDIPVTGRPLRVVFVACNRNRRRFMEDPSFLYRCQSPAAALQARGHEVTLTHVSRLNPWSTPDLVVFHRPRNTIAFRAAVAVLRRRGVRIVADVDDLIFDPALAEFSPGVRNHLVPLADMQSLFASHHKALRAFDAISVSTEPLEDEVHRCFPHAHVTRLPNAVHHSWRTLETKPPATSAERPIISYLPGTRSHDRDFATVAPVLEDLLSRHADLELHVTGPLEFELKARSGQVRHFPKLPFWELHPRVRSAWVNIAPLEPTPFTRCKSALKVMEAGYWGIPTVCSPLPDARRFANAGAIMSGSPDEWHTDIEQLLLDAEHHAAQTESLRERVLRQADVYAVMAKLLAVMEWKAAAA